MNRKQPFTFAEFKEIYSKVPRLCVDLVITTEQGYLLTLRQKNGYVGQWHFPGVTVYFKESIEEAIHRAAKEELGVDVKIEKFLEYIEYFSEEKERGFGYTVSLAFLCTISDTNFSLDDQVEKVGFFKTPPENTIQEQKVLLNNI